MMWEDWGKHGTTSADTSAAVTEVPDDEDSDMAQDSEPEHDDLQEDNENDDAAIDEPKRAKNRLDLLFLSDEEFDGALKGALRRSEKIEDADASDAASDAEDAAAGESDEIHRAQGRKRKSARGQRKSDSTRATSRSRSASVARVATTTKKRKTDKGGEDSKADKGRARGVSVAKDEKKQHDLRAMAEAGQGGRVMFVFEKISQSRM